MSDLLSIGASGVSAYNTALTTVSENIANVGVAGYSRRSTVLGEVSATAGGLTAGTIRQGNGVTVTGIARAGDQFKAAAVRTAGADLAKTESGSVWLDRIQSALTGNQLGDQLTGFFTSATALAADPTSSTARAQMLEAGASVANAFTATGKAIDQAYVDLDAAADAATQQLGSLASALAKVNDGLTRTPAGTSAAAQLADQRDQLLESMSAVVDLSSTTDSLGRATVKIGGGAGSTLVANNDAGSVTYVRNAAGQVSFAVFRAGETGTMTPTGGALAGIVDGAARLTDAAGSLDTLAKDFVDGVNKVQLQGSDLDAAAGTEMFKRGTSPTDVTLILSDPRKIAASAVGGGARDASNLSALQATRTAGAFEGTLTGLVSANAASIASRKTVAEAQTAIRDGAVSARDAVSGVDMDREAVDLLRFQQAYQASSRVIQVARETFQSILNIN